MISSEQAAEALKQVTAAEQHSRAVYNYSQSAPYCFIWGAAWLLGYGAEALAPLVYPPGKWIGWWWMGLTVAGAAAGMLIAGRQASRLGRSGWRFGALYVIIWLYLLSSFSVLHPHNDQQVGAYIPLLFAAIYAATGLWLGLRYILVGAFMAAATLAAYFFLKDYFFLWMALVGGGSLILTGFWLQRA